VAGGEGVDRDDPYRVLQVDPGACPQVIAAAFTVLREMVLRSEADDAPRQLARLGAAHRTLSDPERRAAHDLARGVSVRPLDEDLLQEALTLAVANAAPAEVMPVAPGPPGWTLSRREAFLEFHRARLGGLSGPAREQAFAILVEGRPVGVGRIGVPSQATVHEIGLWLGRSARGRGIEAAALRALAETARDHGAESVIARDHTGAAGPG
jgi:RimJ/RimL family protein N-acetyltransferase